MKRVLTAGLLVGSLFLGACNNDTEDVNEQGLTAEQQAESDEIAAAEDGSNSMHEQNETVNYTNTFGETVDLTIKSVTYDKDGDYSAYEDGGDLYPDGKFIKIIYKAKNVGTENADVMGIGDSTLLAEDGTEYTSLFTGFESTNEDDTVGTIKPKLEDEIYSVYNVPSDFNFKNVILTISTGSLDNEQIETYKLKDIKE
ncbi:hypothetical protein [Kurthia sp. Dielmo]|uniref:hypothetical protein n=1 Tax=Kurthia sp. Dielmo TaxID=1033738 RepID=UPI001121916C|nr:hypothetical protein [Kurthia sp. Dielmo]